MRIVNPVPENDLSWRNDTAACLDPTVDPEWFFDESHEVQLTAARVCLRCPLVLKCREYALYNRVDGVWGGLTERGINAKRKELNIIPYNISGDGYLAALGLGYAVRGK